MNDNRKTKERLLTELQQLRRRNVELEQNEKTKMRSGEIPQHQTALLDHISDAVISTDLNFNIQGWNKAAEEIYGWKKAEVLGKLITEVIETTYIDESREIVLQDFKKNDIWKGEVIQRGKNKKQFYISAAVSLVKDAEGQNACIVAVNRDITEQKETEAALRESRERLRVFMENYPANIYIKDSEFKYVYANHAFLESVGKSEHEFVGSTSHDYFPEESARAFEHIDREVLEKQKLIEKEIEIKPLHGEVCWKRILKFPLNGPEGEKMIGGISVDITKRKRIEFKLQHIERRYKEIFEGSRDGFMIVDIEGHFIDANKSYCNMLSYTIDELRRKDDFYQITPEKWREWERDEIWYNRLFKNGYSGIYEKEYIRKDGSIFPVELQSHAVFDEHGDPEYLWGVARDITERKQAEKVQRESEEKFRTLFEQAGDAIVLSDNNGRFLSVNRQACKSLGYTQDELLSLSFHQIDAGITDPKEVKSILNNLKLNQSLLFESTHRRKDGSTFPVEVRVSLMESGGQQIFLNSARDITERKRAVESLRESEELLKETQKIAKFGGWEYNVMTGKNKWTEEVYALYNVHLDYNINDEDNIASFFPQGDREKVSEAFRKCIEEGEPYDLDVRFINAKGEHRYVRTIGNPVFIDEKVVRVRGNFVDITERKQAEDLLRQERNRAQNYLNIASVMFVALDSKGRITMINPRGLEILGYEENELIGRDWFNTCLPQRLSETVHCVFEQLMAGKVELVKHYKNPVITKRGDERNIEWHNSLIIDEEGNFSGTLSSGNDITERKQAEDELTMIFDMSLDMICIADINTATFKKINPAFERTLGYSEQELLERPFLDFIHPDDIETTTRVVTDELQKGKKVITFENRYRCKDGSYRWLDWNSHPIAEKGVTYAIAHDVTEWKQAAEEQQKLISLIENSNEFIGIASPDGNIIYLNEAGMKLVGFENWEEIKQKTIFDFVSEEAKVELQNYIFPELFKRGFVTGENTLRHGKTAEMINVHYNFFLTSSTNTSESTNIAIVMNDITKRKRAEAEKKKLEEQLSHSQKMEAFGTLAGGVAHDFNNLLTAILGNAELVLSSLNQDNPIYEDVDEIKKAAKRAAALTNQLLAFSRRQPLQKKVLNVNDVVNNVQKMIRRLIGEDIRLHFNLDENLFSIFADPYQIEQVIINVVVNARDAMPDGGRLDIQTENITVNQADAEKIKTAKQGHFICLLIRDSGKGIAAENIDRIFDPFFTTKGPGGGTGLGLSVVLGIVEQHNGWLHVESEIEKGTTFYVYLPVISEISEQDTIIQAPMKIHQGNGERILLIEDEEGIREFLIKLLEMNNYKVVSARNAAEALNIFKQQQGAFDLIFSDVVLPDKNGLQLAEEIISKQPNIKVLLSSGYLDEKSRTMMIREKGYSYLQKPYGITELLKTLQSVLKYKNEYVET